MGLGDDLLATAEARRLAEEVGRPVLIGRWDRIHWSPLYKYNPDIIQARGTYRYTKLRPYANPPAGDFGLARTDLKDVAFVDQYTGRRPYIDRSRTVPGGMAVRADFRVERGRLVFSESELREAVSLSGRTPFVVVEPSIKGTHSSGNKGWIPRRWQEVADRLAQRGIRVVQVSPPGERTLRGVQRVATSDVRVALAVLARLDCRAVICTEGLMHHAAAAVDVPAVVIFGGRLDPRQWAYPGQAALYHGSEGSPCGMNRTCMHCAEAMQMISVDNVMQAFDLMYRP